MSLNLEKYNDFVEALDFIDDEDMRFEYIIDVGKRARANTFPESWQVNENLMHGCMSRVWIVNEPKDGRHYFKGDSDAIIVKGLVTMMTESFSGLTADELSNLTVEQVSKLNLGALTTQRQVGMLAMLEYLKKLSRQSTHALANAE